MNQEPEPTEQQINRLIEHRRFVEKQKSLLAEEARNKDLLPQTSLMYTSSYLFDILKEFPDLFKGFNAQIFLSPSGGLRAPQVFTYLDTVLHQIDERIASLSAQHAVPAAQEFLSRGFHQTVFKHSEKLFLEGFYFHAVFEAAKVYNNQVKEKSQSTKDGEALMMDVWGWQNGVLKVTPCQTETDRNVQDGIKFLSGGLMRAVRNPTAHEPALEWPISKDDCLDILSFISFLFRQLDKAVHRP